MASGLFFRISCAHCPPLGLELIERHDLVHHAHLVGLLGGVLLAEVPDLPRPLLPDQAGEVRRAEATVERADDRAGLPEDGVVRGDA